MLESEWDTTTAERDLEPRVRRLELRATVLEANLDHRFARLKAEIETQIWEDRLRGLLVISIGLAVVLWVSVIVSWLR